MIVKMIKPAELNFDISKSSRYYKNKKLSSIQETEIIDILKFLSPRRKMIDVGSGEGFWTLYMSKFFDEILSIEPIHFSYNFLKKNTKNISNIKTYNFSLSDENSSYDMVYFNNFLDNFDLSDSMSSEKYITQMIDRHKISEKLARKILLSEKIKKQHTKCFIFDDLDMSDRIDFINIDTNCDELKILKGMIKTIDVHRPKIRVTTENSEVKIFLKKFNYVEKDCKNLWHFLNRKILI